MRIAGLVLIVSLLATLVLMACVPVELTPAAPAATAAPTAAYTPPPAPAMPTPPPCAVPASTDTKSYEDLSGTKRVPIDLKTGNIVVITVKPSTDAYSLNVDVDAPALPPALMPQTTLGGNTGKYSFRAAMDGTYTVNIWQGRVPFSGGSATVTIDIYS